MLWILNNVMASLRPNNANKMASKTMVVLNATGILFSAIDMVAIARL